MFAVGDVVMYRRDLCKIIDFHKNEVNKEMYYVLEPLEETATKTKIQVPVANRAKHLRELITKEEIDNLIHKAPDLEPIQTRASNLKNEYISLLNSGSQEDLLRIIKTTYLKNKERLSSKKKVGMVDESYFQEAEKCLYTELGYVLHMNTDEIRMYLCQEIEKACKENK